MSVAVLLITHNRIGAELLDTASRMLGRCPLPAAALAVSELDEPEGLIREAASAIVDIDQGAGVLVLTDLFGSTPSNVANALKDRGNVRVLTGVNLPMLVRALNYPGLDLAALAEKAVSGGRDGVMACPLAGEGPAAALHRP